MAKVIAVAIALSVLLVGAGLWRHDATVRGDGAIARRDSVIARDSVTIDSLKTVTQAHVAGVTTSAAAFARVDTAWRKHSDTVPVVIETIVHDTLAPDSAKIRQLAALVLDTKRKADAMQRAAEAASDSVAGLLVSFDIERAGWENQRATMATQIVAVKKQVRRWGVGGSIGYDPLNLDLHKPRLQLGLVFIY